MNGVLNWPHFRSRVIVGSFRFLGWIIVIMWDEIRTQFCQGRVVLILGEEGDVY